MYIYTDPADLSGEESVAFSKSDAESDPDVCSGFHSSSLALKSPLSASSLSKSDIALNASP